VQDALAWEKLVLGGWISEEYVLWRRLEVI
jgi:hypothetical protein